MRDLDQLIRTARPLELKLAAAPADTGEIAGYASVFGGEPDSYGDIIAPGAFAESLADLARRRESPVMLWAHDPAAPIGRWTSVHEDERGLRVRGQLNLESSRGREALAHLKAGDVSGLSIGYRTIPGSITYHDDGTQTLTAIDLREISVVSIPAKREARVTAVKSLGSPRELEAMLHKSGLSRGAAAKIAAAGWQALNGEQDQPDFTNLGARIKAATAEIRGLKGGHY